MSNLTSGKPANTKKNGLRYLALGDSYTIGEGVLPQYNYPTQTKNRLEQENLSIDYLKIVAKTGWTTAELLEAIDDETFKNVGFDLVTLLIGVNNQYRGLSLTEYEKEFRLLIAIALEQAKSRANRVTVISIPDWGVTAFGASGPKSPTIIAQEIDEFNKVNKKVAEEYGTNYLDITEGYRMYGGITSHQAEDGLHPSLLVYEKWANELSRIISENFSRE